MYTQFFNLRQAPFSIAPDPHYLFMSERHREALAHLLFGLESGGGFVLLTGEIGAGKTTICRCLLEQVPANCQVAYIFNPKLSVLELLRSICEDFHLPGPKTAHSIKDYVDLLNDFLLSAHAQGRNSILIIDEAQNLSADVLEQLRLLTNLETNERKLLQVILIGQPELREMVARPQLEQLAQRMIARYHLGPLGRTETIDYIRHRMMTAGWSTALPFSAAALNSIYRITGGVPRRINLLCDRALLGAYAQNRQQVDSALVKLAAREIFGVPPNPFSSRYGMLAGSALLLAGAAAFALLGGAIPKPVPRLELPAEAAGKAVATVSPNADIDSVFADLPDKEEETLRQLMQGWGVSVSAADPCSAAMQADIYCYRSNGGLAELRALNRPAIVALQDGKGVPRYALLSGLGINTIAIRSAGTVQLVNVLALARYFQGNFVTAWRAPAGFSGPINPGDKSPAAGWVAQRLNVLVSENAEMASTIAMTRAVRDFQITQGLKADGIAGPKTIMYINRATGVDEPHLDLLAELAGK